MALRGSFRASLSKRNGHHLAIKSAKTRQTGHGGQPSGRPASDVDVLIAMARVVAGAAESAAAHLTRLDVAVGDRATVEIWCTRDGWSFRLRGRGKGRTAGVDPTRILRDYESLLAAFSELRRAVRNRPIAGPFNRGGDNRWLRKLALRWDNAPMKNLPAWLQPFFETEPLVVPLARIPWKQAQAIAGSADSEITFETTTLDVSWNEFVRAPSCQASWRSEQLGFCTHG